MTCPNCSHICNENDRFCYYCGAPLITENRPRKGSRIVPILILSILSLLGILLFFLHPLTEPVSDTPWFILEEGVLYFDETLYEGSSEVTVPATVNGQPVLHLGDGCFEGTSGITTVHLPEGLLTVGDGAFYGCDTLRGIALPEGLESIGVEAFSDCTALEAITIPGSVTDIGDSAFTGCESLKHIFYDGEFRTWQGLYQGHINLYTHVYCTDGDHLHR